MDEIALLYQISRQLNSDLDINRILEDAIDVTVDHFGANNGSILIFDKDGSVAHKILARAGMPSEKMEFVISVVLSQGLAGWIVEKKRGAVVSDVHSDPRWISFPDDPLVGGSAIGVPLLRRERVVGVLTLRHSDTEHFTEQNLDLLSSIGDQGVIAIENARLFHSVQAERAKMEAIINDAGDAILVTDQQGQVLLMNAVARSAFSTSDTDTATSHYLPDLIPDHALHTLWKHREEAAYPSTGEIPLPGNRTFHASLTSVPNVGFVIVMQDITDLKELEQMRSEFVAAVSHDLRSPLQLIHTYASLLPDAGTLNDKQQEFIGGINRSVKKMAALIGDLLDLAKIEAGVDMDREQCHLDLIVKQVVGRLQGIAHRKGLRIESEVPAGLPPVSANGDRMDQVLSNLIDNALKYTLEGTVTVRAFVDENRVTIHVVDTGIGLMPQEQKRLFTKFYRVGNERTADVEGTGLGLAIAKSIVEQHGGKIWVQSTYEKGSTFAFSIPRNEQEST